MTLTFDARQAALKAISRSILSIDRRIENGDLPPDAETGLRAERTHLIEARAALEQDE